MKRLGKIFGILAVSLGLTGCGDEVLEEVTFELSENLEVAMLKLIFTDEVQLDYQGVYAIGSYGVVYANPYIERTSLFEIGLELDTDVVNEQNYVGLTPTTVLPNGSPLPVPYPVVEISSPTPIGSDFDLMGYVDVTEGDWLGAAVTFGGLHQNVPDAITVSKVFEVDDDGNAVITGVFFGPVIENGTVTQDGGLAAVVNVGHFVSKAKKTGVRKYRWEMD